MHCPRCGTEYEQGDRFCANCGASLQRPRRQAERLSPRQRARRLVGTSRRARLITGGTALAIVVAVIALIALPGNDSGIPRDAYTIAADRVCVNAKKQIGAASNRALADSRSGNAAAEYARSLVPIVGQWRVDFDALHAPADRVVLATNLDSSLREVEIEAASLALAAGRGAPDLAARAKHVDQLTESVEHAVHDLGLDDCSRISIAPGAPPPS